MEKQRYFLLFIVIGGFIILLQQGSLLTTNHHQWNKSTSNTGHSTPQSDDNAIHELEKSAIKWNYNKFIHEMSKTLPKNDKIKSKEKMKSIFGKFNPLSKFPLFLGHNQTRVLLFAYFRSGSSFVGDLLQQNWKSFYSFEPLHYMTRQTRIDGDNVTSALQLINNIYNCDFSQNLFYIQWAEKNQFLLKWNKFFWNICKFRPSRCFDYDYLRQACQRSRYNIIKTVRLQMKHLEQLWHLIEPLQVKVIYLVRDPRGIYNSRKNMEWCNKEEVCANLSHICAEMRQDLIDYDRIKTTLGDNLQLVRYEDISSDPMSKSRQVFATLNLDFSASVSRFLRSHTSSHNRNEQNQNPYSTYRANSSFTATQWRKNLNDTELEFAHQHCNDIFLRLNYTLN